MSNASKAKKQNQFAETFRLLCRNKTHKKDKYNTCILKK